MYVRKLNLFCLSVATLKLTINYRSLWKILGTGEQDLMGLWL
jgi:hypothetical protein